MRVVNSKPPLFDEIAAAFPGAHAPGVIFCWGDKIHAPKPAGAIGPELIAHEQVHCDRQGSDIEGWWRRYIVDERFRLIEEFPAHVAECKALCLMHRHKWVSARSMRRTFAAAVARKLAAPLYGNMISVAVAKGLILEAMQSEGKKAT